MSGTAGTENGRVRIAATTTDSATPCSPPLACPTRAASRVYRPNEAPASSPKTTPSASSGPPNPAMRATPSSATTASSPSRARRDANSATAHGPRKSSVVAIPSGSRSTAR